MTEKTHDIAQLVPVLLREMRRYGVAMALIFAFIALAALAVGLAVPRKYAASTTILAQGSDIIQPLLEGRAVATEVTDRAGLARQVIFSRKVMSMILEKGGWLADKPSAIEQDRIMEQIKSRTTVNAPRPELIQINYHDSDPRRTLEVTQQFAELFIAQNRAAKERESREAFEFIDKQVRDYHAKLTGSEKGLMDYRSANIDAQPGSVADSTARINALRAQVEQARLSMMEQQSRESALVSQLSGESEVSAVQSRSSMYRAQLIDLQNQYNQLLLNFTDKHPDVVRVRLQMQDLQQQLANEEARRTQQGPSGNSLALSDDAQINPLYQELRTQLATARRELAATRSRMAASESMLNDELNRSRRIATSEGMLAELTRDYEVNRDLYQDLLRRRENARVSMVLDEEQRGLTFRIQDPAMLPVRPSGLRMLHFAAAGLGLGVLAPLGLLFALVTLDPRIRSAKTLESLNTGLPLLVSVPAYETAREKRRTRVRFAMASMLVTGVLVCYVLVYWYMAVRQA
ncbi:MAG: hypothetical protein DI562_02315 [Stenotrophomonas acidaminiphila]|nr:MAG: hypothetical protein DI562_02315 [Stenotrophomonas acidaminiphila]